MEAFEAAACSAALQLVSERGTAIGAAHGDLGLAYLRLRLWKLAARTYRLFLGMWSRPGKARATAHQGYALAVLGPLLHEEPYYPREGKGLPWQGVRYSLLASPPAGLELESVLAEARRHLQLAAQEDPTDPFPEMLKAQLSRAYGD